MMSLASGKRKFAAAGPLALIAGLLLESSAGAATVQVATVNGAPGATVQLQVSLQKGESEVVAGTQNDFYYNPAVLSVPKTDENKPQCLVNPDINKKIDGMLDFGFGFLKDGQACNPNTETCNGVRAIVLATDNVDPISLSLLYTCSVKIADGAALGDQTITNESPGVVLSTPEGVRLAEQLGQNGIVRIGQGGGQACACDCDANHRTTGTEITRCVLVLGNTLALDQCVAADSDKSGRVTGTDITRGVLAVGLGSNCAVIP
jgi:hypothetical protein